MAVLLSKAYMGYAAGTVVNLPTSTESSLVSQGFATVSTKASTTAGAVTANVTSGTAAVAAGASSVVITNNLVDANSKIWAAVGQSTADTTFTSVLRIVPAVGSFTIFGPANATAATLVDWALLPTSNESGT
jgi:hypothetical protein